MDARAQKVLSALDAGQIEEAEARQLLAGIKASPSTPEPEYIEKSPEELGVIDRAIAESFGANPEAKLAFYQKKYPDSKPELKDGRITFLGGDNKRYFADPDADGFDGIGEFSRDALEAVVPIGSGVLESAATGIAGMGGAALGTMAAPGPGTVIGGLGAASAGGALAGDLAERARQKVGGFLGIPNNEDADEIAFARNFGAASPLFLGFDKPARLLKGALKSQKNLGRGLVGMGASAAKNKVFPQIAALTSGKSKHVIKTLMGKYDEIAGLADNQRVGDLIHGVEDEAQSLILKQDGQVKEAFGKALDVVAENDGVALDTSSILAPLKEISSKVKSQFADDFRKVADKSGMDITEQNEMLSHYFSGGGKAKKAATANIKSLMGDTPSFKDLKYVQKTVDGLVSTSEGQVTGSRALRLKDDLNKISGIKKSANKIGLDPLEQKITNLTKDAAKNVDEQVLSLPGNEVFDVAKKNYAEWVTTKKRAQEFFGSKGKSYKPGEATERTINKLVGGSRQVEKGAILDTAEKLELPFEDRAQNIKTLKEFFDPSISPVSDTVATSSRSIPAAALGASAGYFAGELAGGNAASRQGGAVLGGGLGVLAGGPKAIRAYARNLGRASKAKDFVQKRSPVSASQAGNIWSNLLQGQGQ